ncbi:trypsin-like peptidase domain-containing protein [Roseibium sp.]|uniref:trypsin-like peptidase domain-containing protein n=1 Tax=Roseibium sp. TaxID=1936156 RepID=UPI003D15021A
MANRADADRTLAFHADAIMENDNVSSISVIELDTGESIIEIGLVEAETSALLATPNELEIPDTANATGPVSVPVRKRVIGRIVAQSFTDKRRPALGGNSCGPAAADWSGTLGARIEYQGTYCILSNWHVLYGGVAANGDPIVQPASGDGGAAPGDTVAHNLSGVLDAYVDAALATVDKPVDQLVGEGTRCHGAITGIAAATVGMGVRKCGRTTEATTGTVRSTNATVRVSGYPGGSRIFQDQIQATAMSQPGDSGSVVLDDKGRVIGLLFAGGPTDTFANKIERVMEAFGANVFG